MIEKNSLKIARNFNPVKGSNLAPLTVFYNALIQQNVILVICLLIWLSWQHETFTGYW